VQAGVSQSGVGSYNRQKASVASDGVADGPLHAVAKLRIVSKPSVTAILAINGIKNLLQAGTHSFRRAGIKQLAILGEAERLAGNAQDQPD
jgi:hypothetical protein